ncbi:TonB-dependent receptor [Chitinophaga sp. HK235]|uniref:TonB-dependent receptor n=1 Tax=Chitinophaga sp. HK235 TaxID=2952571 RepID=UPI001BAD777A|nr:TonB-dependent receptor [Chitinophaga sp. HK235]
MQIFTKGEPVPGSHARLGRPSIRILFKLMRYSSMLMLFGCMLCATLEARTSNAQMLKDVKISLDVKNEPLKAVLKKIETATSFSFVYNPDQLWLKEKVSLSSRETTVDKVLHLLLDSRQIIFRQNDNHIILLRNEQPPALKVPATSHPVVRPPGPGPVSGRVTSIEGAPMPGVNIRIKGSSKGVVTDAGGNYSIHVDKETVLIFSSLGFQTREMPVPGATVLNVQMAVDVTGLNDVVVVGYGTQKKMDLTGAVSTVDVKKNLRSRPITDVARGLQGVVPGLTITTNSGDLGQEPRIRLRGLRGSLNTGNTGAKPLILVDNVEIPSLQMINPEDIESISVLKDAASASIYGTRGAFGVVLITTKTGKRNTAARISYSNNMSWAKPTVLPEIAGGAEGAEATLAALRRANPDAQQFGVLGMWYDDASIRKIREWEKQYSGQNLGDEMVMGRDFDTIGGRLYFYRPWDAGKMYMRDWSPQQKHDINVSGGSASTSYNLGLGYLSQKGVIKVNPDKYTRYNLNLGVNTTVNQWVDIRSKILVSNTTTTTPYNFSSGAYNPWYYLYRWPATYPYGTYQGKDFRSAPTEVKQASLDEDKSNLSRLSVGTTIKVIEGLTIDADYTYSSTNRHLHQTGGGTMGWNFWSYNGRNLEYQQYQNVSQNKVRYYSGWSNINTGKAFATYVKNIKDHAFKVIAGSDVELYKFTDQSSERRGLLSSDKGEIPLATGDQFVDGSSNAWSTLGFFGRLNYAYKDKYLLEVNGRYDGSSRFPRNNQWGFFPSVSAGYVISEEPFMKPLRNELSFFKIRGSYGSIGNQVVGSNRFLSTMSASNSNWLLPGANQVMMGTPTVLSPVLTWETVRTLDIGTDIRLLKDKVGITFDWFQRTTANMITAGVTLPSSFGASAPVRNFGEMRGTGWELGIDFSHTFSNGLHIGVMATLSDVKEKITRFSSATRALPGTIEEANGTYYEGMTVGEIWGYVTDRLFTEDDFMGKDANGRWIPKPGIASQKKLETSPFFFGPGDVKYKDLNGDSVIFNGSNTVEDPGDKKIIGNSTPRYLYGVRISADWKGFDLDLFFQGVGKRDFWATGPIVFPGFNASEAWYKNGMDYWKPDNPNAFYPRPASYGGTINRWNYQPQTRYLLNMAYLRMKNITVGYTLPSSLTKRIHLDRVRLYFSGENLFEFDHLKAPIDPEVDFNQSQLDSDPSGYGRVYPYRRSFSGGLQVTF